MQRTLLTLALVAAAGTAIAQTSNPPAAGTGSPTTAPSTPSTTAPSADAPAAPSQTMGAGGGATAPGMNQPTGTYDTNTADTNTANAPGRMSGQAGIAQKRIEADGYKNVQGLAQGSDGLWHGRAMRGSTEVQVTVDRQGNVSQQ